MKDSKETAKAALPTWMGALAVAAFFTVIVAANACKNKGCDYVRSGELPIGCDLSDSLNLSTGIDTSGKPIVPAVGAVDPFWKLINDPPRISCSDPLEATIGVNAYVVNYFSAGASGWTNQPGAATLAPVDMGNTTAGFGCNNDVNSQNQPVPYVFERPFCVWKNTAVDFSFDYKGDDTLRLELIENATGAVLSASSTFAWPNSTASNWSAAGLPLGAGSYSIRAYLVNAQGSVLGFSVLGGLATVNGDAAISDNAAGCCENNTISLLNVLESKCDGIYDAGVDQVGNGWTFNLKNASNAIIQTAVTDINGNIFFSGLPDGTYTVQSVPQGGWAPNAPAGGSVSVVISGNSVKIVEFYNCK